MLPVNLVDDLLHLINLIAAFNLQPGEVDEKNVLLLIERKTFKHSR
jgi:hypothetical protein